MHAYVHLCTVLPWVICRDLNMEKDLAPLLPDYVTRTSVLHSSFLLPLLPPSFLLLPLLSFHPHLFPSLLSPPPSPLPLPLSSPLLLPPSSVLPVPGLSRAQPDPPPRSTGGDAFNTGNPCGGPAGLYTKSRPPVPHFLH